MNFEGLAFDNWISSLPDFPYDPCPCGCGKKFKFVLKEWEWHEQEFIKKELEMICEN